MEHAPIFYPGQGPWMLPYYNFASSKIVIVLLYRGPQAQVLLLLSFDIFCTTCQKRFLITLTPNPVGLHISTVCTQGMHTIKLQIHRPIHSCGELIQNAESGQITIKANYGRTGNLESKRLSHSSLKSAISFINLINKK